MSTIGGGGVHGAIVPVRGECVSVRGVAAFQLLPAVGVDGPQSGADHVGVRNGFGILPGEHLDPAVDSDVVGSDDEVVADEVLGGEAHVSIVPSGAGLSRGEVSGFPVRPSTRSPALRGGHRCRTPEPRPRSGPG